MLTKLGAVHKQGTSTPKSSPIVQEATQPIFLNITEDWQLPRKYKRKPLTEEEMEYINVRISSLYSDLS